MKPTAGLFNTRRAHSRAILRSGVAGLVWMVLPSWAQAQSQSPADLAAAPVPSLMRLPPPSSAGQNGTSTSQPNGSSSTGSSLDDLAPFQINAYADLSERYTTNALGVPSASGSNDDDYDSRAMFGVNALEDTDRVNAALNYALSADYFARSSSDITLSNRLRSFALVDVIPDYLRVSAQLFANPIYASQLGEIAPSGEALPSGANGDLRNTYGFGIQPDITFHLGDYLQSDLTPSYNAVYVDNPNGAATSVPGAPSIAGNILTKSVTERLSEGDNNSRLQASTIASYSETAGSIGGLVQRSATGELSYAVVRDISLIGDGGYQWVHSGAALNRQLTGPTILGGLRFDLPKLTGEFRAGEQYHSFSLVGHLLYQITPILSLSASATDSVNSPGAALLNPTSLLETALQGVLSGQIQLPSSGALSLSDIPLNSLGLENSIARIKRDTVSLSYNLNELTADVSAFMTTQDALTAVTAGENSNERTAGVQSSLSYSFNPSFKLSGGITYQHQTLLVGGDDVMEYRIHGDYYIGNSLDLYSEVSDLQRISNNTLSALSTYSGSVSTASVRVGIRYSL